MTDFGALAPEVIANKIFRGSGSKSLLDAAAAWAALADELFATAAAVTRVVCELSPDAYPERSATLMLNRVAPYLQWLTAAAAVAEHTAGQAKAAAAAYGAVVASTVNPPVIAANRGRIARLAATNRFAQHCTVIANLEAAYDRMWAHNAAAMYRYARRSASATQLSCFTPPSGLAGSASNTCTRAAAPSETEGRWLAAVPIVLRQLASPAEAASALAVEGQLKAITASPAQPQLSSISECLNVLSMLITKVSGYGFAGAGRVPAGSRPVGVCAWFSGNRAIGLHRQRSHDDARSGVASNSAIGPAAAVGQLSVPRIWFKTAPINSAPMMPLPPPSRRRPFPRPAPVPEKSAQTNSRRLPTRDVRRRT